MSLIELSDQYLGIKYWALWDTFRTPRFKVFEYYGYSHASKLHYFRLRNGQRFLTKSFSDLQREFNMNRFKPFLINTELAKDL